MYVVHGLYRFAPRGVAFRNDFCLSCNSPRVALQVRSFYAGHLYWIPVLPLGYWRRWVCSACGKDPHAHHKTRRTFKLGLVFILLLMAASLWVVPQGRAQPLELWIAKIGLILAIGAAVWWATLGHRPAANLREQLSRVQPFRDPRCPFCGGELNRSRETHCGACELVLLELKR